MSIFVVAGHLCLDLTPALDSDRLPQPGGLVEAGGLGVSAGGAVGNVGVALARLGFPVRLVGLAGDDWLGERLRAVLRPLGHQPGVRTAADRSTSYSLVLAPRDCDRAFVHAPGANAVFRSANVHEEDLEGAGWLHFGYPPVMPAMAASEGKELAALFDRAREHGLRTSLDFCSISAAAAATDWRTVLRNCARLVTVFAPSVEEMRAALRMPAAAPESLAASLLDMGFAIVALKMGAAGIYLASTPSAEHLARWRLGAEWRELAIHQPCFRANVVNACGAGDYAIAGLIASIGNGASPERAVTLALAAGAARVEATELPTLPELEARIHSGWERLPATHSIS